MSNLKLPLSFKAQVKRMKEFHKIIIEDDEYAENILSRVNYYKLLGYGIGLNNPNNKDEYINCSIEKLFNLYNFDSKIRNLFQLYLEYIEIEFKTKLANYYSLKYGSECYKNPSFFETVIKSDGTNVHTNIISDFDKEVDRHSNLPFVKHHIETYDGHFPFWVAV